MDKFDVIDEIRRLAAQHDIGVSLVTVEDVASLKGVEEPTAEQQQAILDSWEWRHFGDNWSDWFEGLMLDEDARGE